MRVAYKDSPVTLDDFNKRIRQLKSARIRVESEVYKTAKIWLVVSLAAVLLISVVNAYYLFDLEGSYYLIFYAAVYESLICSATALIAIFILPNFARSIVFLGLVVGSALIYGQIFGVSMPWNIIIASGTFPTPDELAGFASMSFIEFMDVIMIVCMLAYLLLALGVAVVTARKSFTNGRTLKILTGIFALLLAGSIIIFKGIIPLALPLVFEKVEVDAVTTTVIMDRGTFQSLDVAPVGVSMILIYAAFFISAVSLFMRKGQKLTKISARLLSLSWIFLSIYMAFQVILFINKSPCCYSDDLHYPRYGYLLRYLQVYNGIWMTWFAFSILAIADFIKQLSFRSWVKNIDMEISRLEQEAGAGKNV